VALAEAGPAVSALRPAPPGLPATLVAAREIPVDQRLGGTLVSGAVFAALAAFTVWRGIAWPWALAGWGLLFVVVVASSFAASVDAGNGWLRAGKTYVRTDRLVELRANVTLTGTRVRMRDDEGRTLLVRLTELDADPALMQLVRSDVRTSLANGLRTDARSRRLFE